MAIPPFNELRLEQEGGSLEDRLKTLCEAYARNFEDLYNRYQTASQVQEQNYLRSAITGSHKTSWGVSIVTFTASKESAVNEITHGLGVAPTSVVAIAKEAPGLIPIFSWTPNGTAKFKIRAELSSAATGNVAFTWVAFA